MTEEDLATLVRDNPVHGIPCLMLDGHVGMLRHGPSDADDERKFGFVLGDGDVRWCAPGTVEWVGQTLSEIVPAA